MTDIVERARLASPFELNNHLITELADEIERLREAVRVLGAECFEARIYTSHANPTASAAVAGNGVGK